MKMAPLGTVTTTATRGRAKRTAAAAAAVGVLFLLISEIVTATSTTNVLPGRVLADSETGLVSFPLVPQHVQRRRLGLETNVHNGSPRNVNVGVGVGVGVRGNHYHQDHQHRHQKQQHGRRFRRRHLNDENNNNHKEHEIMAGLYMGYGTHYVDIYCGSPPQRQTVIVDTGSSLTAFPCSQCNDCGAEKYHTGPLFNEDKSSTFTSFGCDECSQRAECNKETNQCEIQQYYSEGSFWNAYEAMDVCYLGGYHNKAITEDNGNVDDVDPGHAAAFAFDTSIGCQTKITGLFKTQLADGIMGMSDSKQSFWHQMYRAHKIRQKQFSLCYTRPPHALREGTEAGALTLGGSDQRLHDRSPMVYTTLAGTSTSERTQEEGKSGYFDIHVREMYLREGKAGESALSSDNTAKIIKLAGASMINDEEGGVIVDSGTTDTYFSEVIKKQLTNNWEKLAGLPWGHDKLTLTPQEVAKLPTLLMQFAGDVEMNKAVAEQYGDGDPNKIAGLAGDLDKNYPYDVVVAIPASHYMEGDGTVTNRMYATETDGSVLGANALIGHDVMFDAQNMRIGWAESSCDYFGLVESSGYTSAMVGNIESEEDAVIIKEEDEEFEKQEDEKEAYDEVNVEEEIEEDKENIQDFVQKGGKVEDFKSRNITIPIDDLLDNPAIAGIVFALLFLAVIFCICKCCVPATRKRRRRTRGGRKKHYDQEIEFGTTRRRSYRDNFDDEGEGDSESDFSDYDDRFGDADDYDGKGL